MHIQSHTVHPVDCSGFSCYLHCFLVVVSFVDSMYVFQDVSDDCISTADIFSTVVEKSDNIQADESKLDTRRFLDVSFFLSSFALFKVSIQ